MSVTAMNRMGHALTLTESWDGQTVTVHVEVEPDIVTGKPRCLTVALDRDVLISALTVELGLTFDPRDMAGVA